MTQQELLLILIANVVALIVGFGYAFKSFSAERGLRPTRLRIANIFLKAVLASGLATVVGMALWSLARSLYFGTEPWKAPARALLEGLAYGTPLALFGVPGSLVAALIAFVNHRRGEASRAT